MPTLSFSRQANTATNGDTYPINTWEIIISFAFTKPTNIRNVIQQPEQEVETTLCFQDFFQPH